MSIEIIGGDLSMGRWDVVAGADPVLARGLFGEKVHLHRQISDLQVLTEERKKKLMGMAGWGFVGALALGPVGALAGMILGGNRKQILVACTLADGRRFVGLTDPRGYQDLVKISIDR